MRMIVNKGDRFNSLSILEEVQVEKGKKRRFRCQCDCGNVIEVNLNNLTSGHVKSCGKCNYKEIKIGDVFSHWTVIGDFIRDEKSHHKKYLCECDCENKTHKYVDEHNLKKGKSISCGCVTAEVNRKRMTKHSGVGTRLFTIWVSMRDRCNNPNNHAYKNYGGRGISICPEWDEYVVFKEWALSHGYTDELTIDRINVNGNYEPANCRWATTKEQGFNRRNNVRITYNGETHTISEWAEITGIRRQLISARYHNGYPLEDVFYKGKFDTQRRRIV